MRTRMSGCQKRARITNDDEYEPDDEIEQVLARKQWCAFVAYPVFVVVNRLARYRTGA